jgi:two-component system LytT family response regulator
LQTITGLLILHRSEILYFQYNNTIRSWQIVLTNREIYRLRVSTTSKEILNISMSFYQVNQNYIINIDYLISIENKTFRCLFYPPYDTYIIMVTRCYYTKLKEALEII